MAISTEVIRKITIQGTTQGVAQATDELNKLAAAQGNVAVVSDTSSKRALSAEAAYNRQTLSVVAGARAQADLERSLRVAKSALDQGIIGTEEHAKRVGLLNEKYGQASIGAKAFAAATSGVSGQLIALSAGAGPVGVFLSALGPMGIAAAVGIGTATAALHAMADAASELAQKAQELRRFAEITGLSTAAVQALRSEASKFGVTSDEAQNAIQQFTARFNELRLGQGELLTQIRRVNPALADQMASVTNAGDALTLFGQALLKVDDIFQRNALVKAATGRGGLSAASFLAGLDVGKVTQSYVDAGRALDENLIKKLAQLQIDIDKTSAKTKQNFASIFAEDTLRAELQFQTTLLEISNLAKNFQWSAAMVRFMDLASSGSLGMAFSAIAPGLRAAAALGAGAGNALVPKSPGSSDKVGFIGPSQPTPVYFNDRFSAATGLKTLDEYNTEKLKKLVEVMGAAATPAQQLAAKMAQLGIAAKDAGLTADQLRRAQGALNEEFRVNQLAAMVSALGSAATVSEQYKLRVAQLHQELDQGKISQETFNRAVAGLKVDEQLRGMRDTISALGDLATPMQQYVLRVAELKQQLDQGRISQDTFNTAVLAAHPAFKDAMQAGESFTKGLVSNLQQGQSLMDGLVNSTRSLSQSLASTSIGDLFKGNFSGALFTGIGALISGIFGSAQTTAQKQQQNQAIQGYRDRAVFAGTNPDSLEGQLTAFDIRARAEQAALPNGGLTQKSLTNTLTFGLFGDKGGKPTQELIELQRAQEAERLKVISDYNAKIVEAEKKAEADRLQVIEDFGRAMNEVQNKGFLNDFADLFKQIAAYQTAGVGPGQLADFFALSAQKIVDDSELTGDAFNNLLDIFPQLTGVVHESTKALQDQAEEQTRAAKAIRDATNANAKTIVEYVNGLFSGSGSTLSPQNRLTSAQAAYNSQLGLAQAGNSDAQANITKYAEDLRTAARDFYGSSVGYQQIFQQITSQLLALPDVQNATDPTVLALRDVVTAINAGNATQALDSTMQGVVLSAINAGNAIAIAALLVPRFDQLNTTADQGLDFNEFVAGLGPLTGYSSTSAAYNAAYLPAIHGDVNTTAGMAGYLPYIYGDGATTANYSSYFLPGIKNDGSATASSLGPNVRAIFDAIDTNGDGFLTKAELIVASTQGTKVAVDPLYGATNAVYGATNAVAAQGSPGVMDLMRQANDTSAQQLNILNAQLSGGSFTFATSTGPRTGGNTFTTVDNNLLTALNKIVFNTRQTADATGYLANHLTSPQFALPAWSNSDYTGALATGGIIPAGGLALVSEHSPGGGRFIRAGSEPITVSPFSASNDNSALVGEVRALREQVATLQQVIAGSDALTRQSIEKSGEHVADTVENQGERAAAQERQSNRQRRSGSVG